MFYYVTSRLEKAQFIRVLRSLQALDTIHCTLLRPLGIAASAWTSNDKNGMLFIMFLAASHNDTPRQSPPPCYDQLNLLKGRYRAILGTPGV